ncbi:type II toxin-antitoxin system RelE/ParE family toxin [Promicromonospora sp. NPDC057488]|uniref:type II toxin-antitoxin system RelE family toxin n=1 Tax=Promicromonospora sp. NPDC057488 TaxID=3346147 RepID=UPI0036701628
MSKRYSIAYRTAALRDLDKLRRNDQRAADKVKAAIEKLADDPRPWGSTKLSGHAEYRIAVNDHRVIYEISDAEVTVTVVKIGNRKDVYRGW